MADSRCLCRSIRNLGQKDPLLIQQTEELSEVLEQHLQDDDILLTLGAGNIGTLAANIAEKFG